MKSNNPPQAVLQSYLAKRHAERLSQPRKPLPSLEEVRREMGWGLIPHNNITITIED